MNVAKIKGTDNAMKTGMLAAEAACVYGLQLLLPLLRMVVVGSTRVFIKEVCREGREST
jgi:hypothetical protein